MRQDQFLRLQQLEEKLLDAFLDEADPEHWPGRGQRIGDMDAKTRGDLYWVRKTAASVAVLRFKALSMIDVQRGADTNHKPAPGADDPEASQLDAEIAAAEKEAAKLMRELTDGGPAKAKFDRTVHGRTPAG